MDDMIRILQRIHQNHIMELKQEQGACLYHLRLAVEKSEVLSKSKD